MLALSLPNLQIKDLFKGDLQLTSPPNVYLELMRVIDNPNKSVIDVGLIIENDPALSIRLLKIVNSAFYNFPAQIGSIARAVSIIGSRELQNLVLATIVIDRFSSMPGGLLSMHDFWAKSVRCALLSKELAIYKKLTHDLDSIFICGLLHDIGQLVFYRRIPVLAREVGLCVQATGIDEISAEEKVIGFNHYDTGAELCRLWNLPVIIIESIARHVDTEYEGLHADIAAIVRMAHSLSGLDLMSDDVQHFSSDIPSTQLSEIIDKTHEQFEQVFKLFYPG